MSEQSNDDIRVQAADLIDIPLQLIGHILQKYTRAVLVEVIDHVRRLKAELRAERKRHAWVRLRDRMPVPDEHPRVLIYTEGHDWSGCQFFDVSAEALNECSYTCDELQPDECRLATHWRPLPDPGGAQEEG